MINVFGTGKIDKNGTMIVGGFNGELLKVVVVSKKVKSNVKVKIVSNDEETLIEDYLNKNLSRFYPKNVTYVTNEQRFIENYYISGSISISIEGLGDKEYIDNIVLYYR